MPVYALSVSMQDEAARISRMQFFLNAADEADALANFDELVIAGGALSGALVTGVNLSRPIDQATIDTINAAIALVGGARPLADHDVEKGARFMFRATDGDPVRITIPAIRGIYITPGGEVDQTAGGVTTFITAVTGSDASDEDGNDITALTKAYKVFKDRGQV